MSVIWLTGPADSGKSTLARALRALVQPIATVAVLDEDDIERTPEAPAAASQLSRTARALARQGMVVIVSSSDTDVAVSAWNRQNLPGYREVRLRASPDTLGRRQKRRIMMSSRTADGSAGDDLASSRRGDTGRRAGARGRIGPQSPAPPPEPDLTIDMDEPEPPELLAFRVGVLIPEFVVATADAAGQTRHWQGRSR